MRRRLLSGTLALACALGVATAADATGPAGRYEAYGVFPFAPCGSLYAHAIVQDRLFHFVEGYLTGFNRGKPGTFSLTGPTGHGGADVWLKTYCTVYPDAPLLEALEDYVQHQYADRWPWRPWPAPWPQAPALFGCAP
jgi:hypothetical protein